MAMKPKPKLTSAQKAMATAKQAVKSEEPFQLFGDNGGPSVFLPQTLEEYVQKLKKPEDGRTPVFDYDEYLANPTATVERSRDFEPDFGDYKKKVPQEIKNLSHPTHLARLRMLRDQGLMDGPEGTRVNPWYWPSPLLKEWTRELGDQEGQFRLGEFLDLVGATSPQTNVSMNVKEASLMQNRGRDLDYSQVRDNAVGGPGKSVPGLQALWGELTGAAKNNKVAMGTDVLEGRGLLEGEAGKENTRHKVGSYALNLRGVGTARPEYDYSSKGNGRLLETPVTLDSMMAEAMQFRDKNGKDRERFVGGPYMQGARVIRNLGEEVNAAGADTQAAIWQPWQAMKNPNQDYSKPFTAILDDRIQSTAQARGVDPKEVLADLIHRRKPLLEVGPQPMPGVSMQTQMPFDYEEPAQ